MVKSISLTIYETTVTLLTLACPLPRDCFANFGGGVTRLRSEGLVTVWRAATLASPRGFGPRAWTVEDSDVVVSLLDAPSAPEVPQWNAPQRA